MEKVKNSISISIEETKKLHGVTIRKLPNGKYFSALTKLEDLPKKILEQVQDMNISSISEVFEENNLTEVIGRLIIIMPDVIVDLMSAILEIEKDYILNTLTPTETLEIIEEFVKINNLESFFSKISQLTKKQIGM